jgi:iron complex transport system permease protein
MNKGNFVVPLLVVLLVVMFAASLFAGRVWLPPFDVLSGLFGGDGGLADVIVDELRLPRAVLAVMVGGALGLGGAVLQGLTRNPLAEPGLLGVSAGASLGAVISIYFGFGASFALATPVFGLLGAVAAMSLTFAISWGGGTLALILAGVAVTGLSGALISLALNLAPNANAAYETMTWTMGSLSDRSWDHVWLVAPFVGLGILLLTSTVRALDALTLGEAQAQSLGINLGRTRLMILFGTATAVGAATSVTGAIGFIGLVAPHLIRPWVGYQPSRTLLPSALTGAILLLAADLITRFIQIGPELKVGAFTSLLGTPFFFWLVIKLRRTSP